MDKSDEGRRYKWSTLATNLLVSIWSHDLVQNQLRVSSRNQPIWESIARYMTRKGFPVTGLQCRTRIKNMLCTYQEAKRENDPSAFKPYFDIFKKVSGSKRFKKTDAKHVKTKRHKTSEEHNDEVTFDPEGGESEQFVSENAKHCEYEMEYFDPSNQESESSSSVNVYSIIQQFENAVVKAIDSQTKAITTAIKMQSQMIEKLLTAEKERFDLILESERRTTPNSLSVLKMEPKHTLDNCQEDLAKMCMRFNSELLPQLQRELENESGFEEGEVSYSQESESNLLQSGECETSALDPPPLESRKVRPRLQKRAVTSRQISSLSFSNPDYENFIKGEIIEQINAQLEILSSSIRFRMRGEKIESFKASESSNDSQGSGDSLPGPLNLMDMEVKVFDKFLKKHAYLSSTHFKLDKLDPTIISKIPKDDLWQYLMDQNAVPLKMGLRFASPEKSNKAQ